METLRAELDLRAMRFQITAAPKPAAVGQPWPALAVWPTRAKSDRRDVNVVLNLSYEGGAWRVANAELLDHSSPAGQNFLRAFLQANRGARPVLPYAAAGMVAFAGRVTKVDEKSITVAPAAKPGAAGPAPAERTLALDERTRVLVPTPKGDQKTPTGRIVPYYTSSPGKVADVKVGQQVTVETPPSLDRAAAVSIDPTHAVGSEGL